MRLLVASDRALAAVALSPFEAIALGVFSAIMIAEILA